MDPLPPPPGSFQPPRAASSSSCLHIPSAGISSWVVAAVGRVWTYLPQFDIPHKEVLRVGVPPTLPLLHVWIQLSSPAQLSLVGQLFSTQSSF